MASRRAYRILESVDRCLRLFVIRGLEVLHYEICGETPDEDDPINRHILQAIEYAKKVFEAIQNIKNELEKQEEE